MKTNFIWDQAIIEKYNASGPRYTSYPTALEFSPDFSRDDFIKHASQDTGRALSLYVHIPFCHKLCYFCACNKVVTRHQHKADAYLEYLAKEIACQSLLFANRVVSQLHLGGGTPSFLSQSQLSSLMNTLRQAFTFSSEAEISIEVDPRELELSTLDHLKALGFNRLSLGVQDFNKEVQKAVNREQDESFIFSLIERAKTLGFDSTNIDLIYGLPLQTRESFIHTLKKVVELSPDRLTVFNYAHMPQLFAAQRKLKEQQMPQAKEKLAILEAAINHLCGAGYQFIGMDHFAKQGDELALAQKQGLLHRNFQGYTTQGDADLLGLGVSAISQLGTSYSQNEKDLKTYYQLIDRQSHALWRGIDLTQDDLIRRDVIKQLICNFELNFSDVETRYHIVFSNYFSEELFLLRPMEQDGLLSIYEHCIVVEPKGHLLIRNICMCFDIYLRKKMRQQQFSKVI